jgi:chromosome segregation ATPase
MKRSDLVPLLEKLSANQQIISNLTRKLEAREAKRTRLADLRAALTESNDSQHLEEQHQMEEFAKITSELNTLRNPKLSARFSSKDRPRIPELEEQFTSLQATSEKREQTLQELSAINSINESHISTILEKNRQMKQRFRKLEKLKVRQPPPVPLILQMQELMAIRRHLEEDIEDARTVRIPQLRGRIERKEEKNGLKREELRGLGAECEAASQDIVSTRAQINSMFAQLEGLSAGLQNINNEMKSSLDGAQSARSQIERLRVRLKQETVMMTEKVAQKRDEVAQIPKRIQAEQDEKVGLLAKRKVLEEQLARKLEDVRAELVERQSKLPVVRELTHELEREWVEHQLLFEEFQKAERKMQTIKEELERTEAAMREVSGRWPIDGRVRAQKGFGELQCTYEEVLIQNRQMALDHAALKDEIVVLEEINARLKAGLRAGSR